MRGFKEVPAIRAVATHHMRLNHMTIEPDTSLDLDSLLADSLLAKQMKKSSHPPKEKAKPKQKELAGSNAHWMNAKERDEFARQVDNAALRALWKPQAAVAMFSVQICLSCGTRNTHFEGFYQQQRHASHRDTEKWVLATDSTMLANLPKHRKVTIHEADSCLSCADTLGYTTPSPTDTEPQYAAWTPHKHSSHSPDECEPARGLSSPNQTPFVE